MWSRKKGISEASFSIILRVLAFVICFSQRPYCQRCTRLDLSALKEFVLFRNDDVSTNSLRDLVVFWIYGFQTLFHTAELSTNSLVDFVVFWNSHLHTVFHTAAYIDSSTIICFHLSMCFMNSKRRLVDI